MRMCVDGMNIKRVAASKGIGIFAHSSFSRLEDVILHDEGV